MVYPSTSNAIETTITGLPATFPGLVTVTPLPNPTRSVGVPARTYSSLKVGSGIGVNRKSVLIVAGLHAREWAQPDAVLTFVGRLLTAYRASAPFTIPAFTDSAGNVHGPVVAPAAMVRSIVDNLDLYMLPNANPDGRAFSQTAFANNDWRKNRVPLPAPIPPAQIGVDLNRNFDIAWDFDVYYSPAAAADPNFTARTSKTPATDVYIGPTSAISEAETRNVKSLLDNHPIQYYVDLHSYSQKVMYSWAIETNQSSDATKNFHNSAFDHVRDGALGAAYQEFFPNNPPVRLLDRHVAIANAMHDSIRDATGASYTVAPALNLYPCTGTSGDYVFSRQLVSPSPSPMYAFAVEFGDISENFHPTPVVYLKIEREIHAALLAFVRYVAVWPALVSGAAAPPAPDPLVPCPIATLGLGVLMTSDLAFLRSLRTRLRRRAATASLMRRVDAVYARRGPAVARFLVEHDRIRRTLARWGLVPVVRCLRALFPGAYRRAC